MKKVVLYFISVLMVIFIAAAFISCSSNDKSTDSNKESVTSSETNSEKQGAVEQLTHEVAKEAVSRIKTPIDRAKAVTDKQENNYSNMQDTLKE